MTYLAACCTVKNESAIINEWMAFHRAAGVQKLIVIDNGSTDSTAEIVERFPDQDSVDLIRWPEKSSQISLYQMVADKYRDSVEWCAFIDADELLYPTDGFDLKETIASFGDVGAICVNWRIYGSAGHIEKHKGLVIETFKQRADDGFIYDKHVKSIVHLKHNVRAITSHMFEVRNGIVDDSGRVVELVAPHGFFPDMVPTYDRLRINHYHCRSKAEYLKKASRGYFGINDEKLESEQRINTMFQQHDQNDVYDDSAVRFIERMTPYLLDKANTE